MRSTQIMRLRVSENDVTLNALIHGYSKAASADEMSAKLIIVGITTGTAEAFVRDALRSSKVPANVRAIGIDTEQQVPELWPQAEYCFFLHDIAAVEKRVFKDLLSMVLRNTKGDRIKFALHPLVEKRFHEIMYEIWLDGLLRTQVSEFDPALTNGAGAFHKPDFLEYVSGTTLLPDGTPFQEAGPLDSIYLEERFALLHPDVVCRMMANNHKCKFVIHPKVARRIFTHLTYDCDLDSVLSS